MHKFGMQPDGSADISGTGDEGCCVREYRRCIRHSDGIYAVSLRLLDGLARRLIKIDVAVGIDERPHLF